MSHFDYLCVALFSLYTVGCARYSLMQSQNSREIAQTIHWESLRLGFAGEPLTQRTAIMDGFLQVIEADGNPVGFFLWESKEALNHGGVPFRSIAIDVDSFISAVRRRHTGFMDFYALQGDLVSVVGTFEIFGGSLLGGFIEITQVILCDQEQRLYGFQINRAESKFEPCASENTEDIKSKDR